MQRKADFEIVQIGSRPLLSIRPVDERLERTGRLRIRPERPVLAGQERVQFTLPVGAAFGTEIHAVILP